MLRLAVATNKETYDRLQTPLEKRGITVEHVKTRERTISLTEPWDGFDVGFVYPTRIMEGGVADALLDVPWVNDREAILTSRNKAGVIAALARKGLPVPETTMVSNPTERGDIEAVFEAFETPVVVKPNSTTRGTGVVKVHDADSFLGVSDYLSLIHDYRATGDKSFLVQEYVEDARDYRVMVLDGEYVGAVERRLPGDSNHWKHNVHRGAKATGVDLPDHLKELAEQTATALDIPLLGVDLLVTDDRAVINETNARPTIDDPEKYVPGFYDRLAGVIRETAEGNSD
ncbi:RimK family alpha-L-glutamate ligase [Haladaptatus sp. DJG-WS-42]|uniref:ATP-grasp domain-containing protein n=1 Tax=Haladaptatus sp. DJG-WS-42 TaxID=3120516 RepID=UPI0030CF7FFB